MSRTRIWYQSMAPLGHLPAYVAALKSHAARACSADVEVHFNGASEALYGSLPPADVLKYPYAKLVVQSEIIEFCRRAEREGFDAVILASFSDPFLPEIRSLLDIPVVSMPEASMLAACSLAEQFALIALGPEGARRARSTVRRHGLESRLAGVFHVAKTVTENDLEAAFEAPAAVIENFTAAAEQAVRAGADAVIAAEGVLNEVLFANGVRRVANATVVDCVGTALLYAEFLAGLKKRLGMGVGRRWTYATPPPELLAQIDPPRPR